MQYLIGFAIGCALTSFVMCKYAGKFAGGVVEKLTLELKRIDGSFEEEQINECKDNR
jgi:hypothetical protein